jgi:hypothetical protein
LTYGPFNLPVKHCLSLSCDSVHAQVLNPKCPTAYFTQNLMDLACFCSKSQDKTTTNPQSCDPNHQTPRLQRNCGRNLWPESWLLGSTYRSETYESVQTTWVRSNRSNLQSETIRIPIPWRSSSKGERDARLLHQTRNRGQTPRWREAFRIQSKPKRSVLRVLG